MTGKEKCKYLKELRYEIAKAHSIPGFEVTECPNTGDCIGTCPACEAELAKLDKLIHTDDTKKSSIFSTIANKFSRDTKNTADNESQYIQIRPVSKESLEVLDKFIRGENTNTPGEDDICGGINTEGDITEGDIIEGEATIDSFGIIEHCVNTLDMYSLENALRDYIRRDGVPKQLVELCDTLKTLSEEEIFNRIFKSFDGNNYDAQWLAYRLDAELMAVEDGFDRLFEDPEDTL